MGRQNRRYAKTVWGLNAVFVDSGLLTYDNRCLTRELQFNQVLEVMVEVDPEYL